MANDVLEIVNLGRLSYEEAYVIQCEHHERVLGARDDGGGRGDGRMGVVLLVEHDPVITLTRRPGVGEHLVATEAMLAEAGVLVAKTDRGGDITYHGPGQLVVYPILDLNYLKLRLHEYMRLLEQAVIDTAAAFGVEGHRDPEATGVWVKREGDEEGDAKLSAMGVRVRRWVTLHGLAMNVRTDLSHFDLIVPCGLHGRTVTSLEQLLGEGCPEMDEVGRVLVDQLEGLLVEQKAKATGAEIG